MIFPNCSPEGMGTETQPWLMVTQRQSRARVYWLWPLDMIETSVFTFPASPALRAAPLVCTSRRGPWLDSGVHGCCCDLTQNVLRTSPPSVSLLASECSLIYKQRFTLPPSAWYSFSSAPSSLASPKSVILTCCGVFTRTFLAARSRCTKRRSSR